LGSPQKVENIPLPKGFVPSPIKKGVFPPPGGFTEGEKPPL